MKIIDQIEIRYFRSIYNINLRKTKDINIFIGNNDVGKSNILRALNLFFNNDADLEDEFDFLRDLSRLREVEARRAKGRATIWMKVTFNNFLNWASLPNKIEVKRSWNRYLPVPNDTYPKGVSATTMGKFLNKIEYHYIPAIRGRNIFTYFLSLLHDSLIDDEKAGVRDASNRLMEKINQSTQDMSEKINEGLGFNSTVRVPEDLRDLFEALDFSTEFGSHSIPLQYRGDGIQGRHIPFILDFIARHSKKHHIWGYEEPENSLELGRAFDLANQFLSEFSEENQIFLTTHSPAFYDLDGKGIKKFLVYQDIAGDGHQGDVATVTSELQGNGVFDERMGVAALIADRSKSLHAEISDLRDSVLQLRRDAEAATRPQLVVEGPTDQMIFDRALKCEEFNGFDLELVASGGTSNAGAFIRALNTMKWKPKFPVFVLLDNDAAGREEEKKNFIRYKFFDGSRIRIINREKNIFFSLLPLPMEFDEISRSFDQFVRNGGGLPLSVEYMFPTSVITRAVQEGVLSFSDITCSAREGELALDVNMSERIAPNLPDGFSHFSKKVDDKSKMSFAEWVVNEPDGAFVLFGPVLRQIREICQGLEEP